MCFWYIGAYILGHIILLHFSRIEHPISTTNCYEYSPVSFCNMSFHLQNSIRDSHHWPVMADDLYHHQRALNYQELSMGKWWVQLNYQWGNDRCSWTINGEMVGTAELSMGKWWVQLNYQWGNDGCSWTVNGEMMGAVELSMGKWWVQLNCQWENDGCSWTVLREDMKIILSLSIGMCSPFMARAAL